MYEPEIDIFQLNVVTEESEIYATPFPLSHVLSTTPAVENTLISSNFPGKEKSVKEP